MFLLLQVGMTHGCSRPTLICAICLLLPALASGQGAVDLSGKWTLDTVLSDSPEQIAAAIRIDVGQGGGDNLFGESGRGGGGRGNGGRERGGPGAGGGGTAAGTAVNRGRAVRRTTSPALTNRSGSTS